ncbi:MAG: decarboxylase [Bacteroidetes bacterium]|nr:decarboxylase [Bacteroidota bacterium]
MKWILPFAIVVIASCGQEKRASVKVEHYGALKNFMHKNDLSAKVDLQKFNDVEHYYALGALENLKGEILFYDSKVFISVFMPGEEKSLIRVSNTRQNKAALLVGAQVNNWSTTEIPAEIKSYEQLESFVESAAFENGVDTSAPFPFLLEGTMDTLGWHIINWPENDSVHTHQKHQTSGAHDWHTKYECQILGFYSKHHHAVFTHHTTNMHMHFKNTTGSLAGHVDKLALGEGTILKLPLN